MPASNPLVEEAPGNIPSLFSGSLSGSAAALGVQGTAGAEAGLGVAGGLDAEDPGHPTNLWYAGVMVVALLGLIALHITGFRFSTDVGVTRG